jgi:hypothetical protein
MDVVLVIRKILGVADPVVGESALPDFSLSTNDVTEGMRVSALEKLNRVLERYVVCGSDEKMDVFGHEDKGEFEIGLLGDIDREFGGRGGRSLRRRQIVDVARWRKLRSTFRVGR